MEPLDFREKNSLLCKSECLHEQKQTNKQRDVWGCTCILLTSAVMIQTFRMPVTDTATTVSSAAHSGHVSYKQKKLRPAPRDPQAGDSCLTLSAMRADDTHGADPVGGDLGHERVQNLQAGGVHHQDFWVMAVAEQASLLLRADGELIELTEPENISDAFIFILKHGLSF